MTQSSDGTRRRIASLDCITAHFMMSDLRDTSSRWGIEPGYHDVAGCWREASDIALSTLTAVIGRGRDEPAKFLGSQPAQAYQGGTSRMWGITVQLYSLRSKRNWGFGDFGDLRALIELISRLQGSAIGLNPLHALFPDRPEQASPYSPSSRLFINPLYIDVEALPEFPGIESLGLQTEVAHLRNTALVDYPAVAHAKTMALRACHARFRNEPDARRRAFETFRNDQGADLARFAAFQVLRAQFSATHWQDWPDPWKHPSDQDLAHLRDDQPDQLEFHEYVQWAAAEQLAGCQTLARHRGMPLGLYFDLAVGVDPTGADAWAGQSTMLNGAEVGAPPDQYNPAGQNWGLTTFNPHALMNMDFMPLRRMLRAMTPYAGAIRIDHALGLMRLYLIPSGFATRDGAYVRYPFEAALAAVAEESQRMRCVVIGEDLGTVPDGFREVMARYGLWRCLVMMFERTDNGSFRVPEGYPQDAVASFNTHDLPTFAGWMSGEDLVLKRTIGVDPGESDETRQWSRKALEDALGRHASGNDLVAAAEFLARTPSRLVMIGLEDILGMHEPINIPGTVDQYPNWRRRLPLSLDQLADCQTLQRLARTFAQAGRASSA
jgi:4-alpha-glucanotransferase